jgi:hypothetical protein
VIVVDMTSSEKIRRKHSHGRLQTIEAEQRFKILWKTITLHVAKTVIVEKTGK